MDIHDPSSSLRFRWVVAGDWKLIVPDRRNEPAAVVSCSMWGKTRARAGTWPGTA